GVIVYDTGALIAAERGDRTMWALHDGVLRRHLSPLVPAGVLAQALCTWPYRRLRSPSRRTTNQVRYLKPDRRW
ncbi:MAG: hypothetical protein ACR2HR_03230, partial [Euzebya sp.]